jgi:hypothetical protein
MVVIISNHPRRIARIRVVRTRRRNQRKEERIKVSRSRRRKARIREVMVVLLQLPQVTLSLWREQYRVVITMVPLYLW